MKQLFILPLLLASLTHVFAATDLNKNDEIPDELLFVSPEMHAYLNQDKFKHRPSEKLMNMLISDLTSSTGLGFEYNIDATFTASKAFSEKQGNCLSFAFLYTALARELGFKVQFNQARVQKHFSSKKALVVEAGHINVLVSLGREKFIVDLSSPYQNVRSFDQVTIEDHQAFASFYNNIAVDMTADENYLLAKKYFETGLEHAPKHSGLLRNYGLLNRLQGNYKLAEKYLLRSSKESKNKTLIYHILSNFYDEIENEKMALKYLNKAKSYRRKNPFYYHTVGMKLAEKGNWGQAIKKLKKSIRMADKCHFLYHDIAFIYKQTGDLDKMIWAMKNAITLAPTEAIELQYQDILKDAIDQKQKNKKSGSDVLALNES